MNEYAILPSLSRPHIMHIMAHICIILFDLRFLMMKIDSTVGKIIAHKNVDHFSTVEIRTAYLARKNDPSIDANDARRFVYNELLKLVKKGWLRKSVSKKKGITTFVKTDKFEASAIILKEDARTESTSDKSEDEAASISKVLIERLNHYKNDLLSGLGEAEEYRRLCEHFPNLQEKLQPKYNQVRESNSKLLGCIKAIENLTSLKQ